MEQLTALYDTIARLEDIKQLVADRAKEDIHLEFKTKKDRSVPDLHPSDAWQFSRALSGFANSDGGILVWGVETDKEDCAHRLKPISSVVQFEARLKKSLLNSVQPFVDSVRIESILDGIGSAVGFVKVLVPRSDKTPHRAMLADREYYRRSTEGFYRLEHFDLEDAFGRRPHPVLVLILELTPRPGEDPHEELAFSLRNDGRGIARYVGVTCEFPADVTIAATGHGWANNTALNRGRPIASYTDNVGVIHAVPVSASLGSLVLKRAAKGTLLTLTVHWYCEGMAEKVFAGSVPPEPQPG